MNWKHIKVIVFSISVLLQTSIYAAHDYEYNTIAGLKAATIPANDSTAYVKGYYAVNDGGGGMFVWDNGSSDVDNGGTVFIPNSLPTTGRWMRTYDKKEIIVNWFGAKGDNSTDDTDTIQNALDLAGDLGGTIVRLLPLRYKITDSLKLYEGVRLLGSGEGTVLYNTGSGAAIRVSGNNYGFEIAEMHILGNNSTDSGIFITNDATNRIPRSANVHDLSITNTGDSGIKLDCFSYILFKNINIAPAGGRGIYLTDEGSHYQELAWFENIYINGSCDIGVEISRANHVFFNQLYVNQCNTGIYIHGNTYNIFFHRTNISNMHTGIEIHSENTHVARLFFDRTTVLMKGDLASEMALYAHCSNGYVIGNTEFNYFDIAKVGQVSPTHAIKGDAGFSRSSFSRLRNDSGGAFSPNIYADIRVDFERMPLKGRLYTSGDGSTKSFTFTLSSESPYHTAPVISVNTNKTIPFSLNVSNTQGGTLSFTVNFATAPLPGSYNVRVAYQIAR